MEAAGLAIGIVALYTTCLDALDKFDTYKAFGPESRQLLAIFQADKKRFEEWANAVGISSGRLREVHSPRLDDFEVASAVKLVLQSLCETLGIAEQTQNRLKLHSKEQENHAPSNQNFSTIAVVSRNKAEPQVSMRGKLEWTFRQRGRFSAQTEMFQKLLERLYNLVPPTWTDSPPAYTEPMGLTRRGTGFVEPKGPALKREMSSLELDIQLLLQETQESARRQALKNIDEWLDAVPSDRQFEECLEARIEGTCEWIFQHPTFEKWIEESPDFNTNSKLLWINGGAGHGKSVLCASIVQHLRSSHSPPSAYFFSAAHAGSGKQPKEVVRSWLSQLAKQDADALYIIRGHMGDGSTGRALQSKAWEVLEDIMRDKPYQTLILDGLDEYDRGDDSRAMFLRELKNRLKDTSTRILLITRDEVDIKQEIHTQSNEDIEGWELYDCQTSELNIRSDVVRFSQHVVNMKLPRKAENLRQEIAEQMADKCEGMFLWIKMQKDYLQGYKSRKQLQDVVKKMPTGLYNTYERNWKAIQSQDEDELRRAVAILHWVVFSARPLTVSELTDALLPLSHEEGEQELSFDDLPETIDDEYIDGAIRHLCGSLVDIRSSGTEQPPESRTIELAHFSVREFLLTVLPSIHSLHSMQPSVSKDDTVYQLYLAETCIRYLNFSEVWQDPVSSVKENDPRPFVEYASKFWSTHYRKGSETLWAAIREFLVEGNPNFQKWRSYFEIQYGPDNEEAEYKEFEPSTPLYYAALFGLIPDFTFPEQSIKKEIDQAQGRFGSPLAATCFKGHDTAFNWLLERNPNINAEGGLAGNALNSAIHKNRKTMVERLLSLGATQDAKDYMGRSALYIAAKEGFLDVLKLTLEHGGDVSTPNKYGWSPIATAADRGHLLSVKLLLEKGVDFTVQTDPGGTPLFYACRSGHVEVAQLLIEHGAVVDTPDKEGWTELIMACDRGFIKVVELLLAKGADINKTDNGNWTPLNSACEKSHVEVVRLLLDKGADPNIPNEFGRTPLIISCGNGCVPAAELLLDHGADYTLKSTVGLTAMSRACMAGHLETIKFLVSRTTEWDIPTTDGWTPLMSACENGRVDIVRFLIEKGADCSARNAYGSTSLSRACNNNYSEVVKVLLDHSLDGLNSANDAHWTPLHYASESGNLEVVKLLLTKGADPTIPKTVKWTPLNNACTNGHLEVAKVLLEHGAGLSAPDILNRTPLCGACYNGHLEVVKWLLEEGADIGALTDFEDTPLHYASFQGHLDVVQLLLDRGADRNARNQLGRTPLASACSNGFTEVAKLLLQGSKDLGHNDRCGRSPLSNAILTGHEITVQLLLEGDNDESPSSTGAEHGNSTIKAHLTPWIYDPDERDFYGCTPLSIAACHCQYNIAKSLLATGRVDTESQDKYGRTPLWWARRRGSDEVVELILDHKKSLQIPETEHDMFDGDVLKIEGEDVGFCDVCTLEVPKHSDGYKCEICLGSSFLCCTDCYGLGARCLDSTHELVFTTNME